MNFIKNKLNIVFCISAITVAFFVVIGVLFPTAFSNGASAVYEFTTNSFGWFYLMAVAFIVVFLFSLAFSKFGKIRLGGDKQKPDYSIFTWISMLFSCGLGIGLVFYGVGEPMSHFFLPPFETIEPLSEQAARTAIGYTFFHYGVSIWGIYAIVGLVMAYFQFRKQKNGLISTSIQPILKKKRNSKPILNTINILAVVATVMGVATSLGMGILQTNGGLHSVFGIPMGTGVQLAIIAVMTVLFILSSSSGLNKGIKWLSNINMLIAIGLMVFVFFTGPTVFILETFTLGIGDYLSNFINYTFRMTPYTGNTWVHDWTIFYWAWTIAWSPFVGSFIARISRGRTIREFVLGVLVAPSIISFLWFAIFGGTALYMDLFEGANIAGAVNNDITSAIFTMFDSLPFSSILSVMAIILIFTFLITSADSATYILSSMTSRGSLNPPKIIRVVWGVLMSSIAMVLLVTSGFTGLQTASLVSALPFTIIILLMAASLFKGLKKEKLVPKEKPSEKKKAAKKEITA
ncbi:BCCT family transporter [Caldibacillus lycopersici]|uniref:BCCT family transporter n=1 Tax=Perspicuibacillus lycopersici TaxID=1325689 RepID=A0AAE3IUA1_9BACI|nr:BCCT family transporter [Perspicuibacillus lycopersici]MCU9613551.1 BCCT family transporter [Perspicuibacillus lycopersici]